ncbi:hypothetical protein LOD99_9390 [Oopsacas minuta]|uniref:Uncharacterized protein n=1 Tax=Oopsacas minuta TaxID=111878 RepID=A0AAV7JBR7_9METZ|nr:hypothetical protein LOD99_9390 [Oopsacas minuta]
MSTDPSDGLDHLLGNTSLHSLDWNVMPKSREEETKERDVQIGGRTLSELGVISIHNQELITGNIQDNIRKSHDIEDLHSLRAGHKSHPTKLSDDCIGKGVSTYVLAKDEKCRDRAEKLDYA